MNSPSRFEITDEQRAINAEGIALCRETIAPMLAARAKPEPEKPLTETEKIHQRALERAITERRNQRLIGLEPVGAVLGRVPLQAPEHALAGGPS